MKKIKIATLFAATCMSTNVVLAADESAVKVSGKLRFYNIGTYKQSGDVVTLDSNAIAIGGQLKLTTKEYSGLYGHVNLMSTNAVFPNDDYNHIDGSVLSKDVKAVTGNAADIDNSITILGEVYAGYKSKHVDLKVGRQEYNSPLAAAKDVRMLLTTFSGASMDLKNDGYTLGLAYFDRMKQRTSDRFYNILEHALGTKTFSYTGQREGAMYVANFNVDKKFRLYNYQINDFINSSYVDYKSSSDTWEWAVQGIYQTSMGYFDNALKQGTTTLGTYTDGVKVSSAGVKVVKKSGDAKYTFAATHTANHSNAYSDIIAPFDGTPLFTDMITANNLFKSLYGGAMAADSGYKAKTVGVKMAYNRNLSKKLKTMVAVARFDRGLNAAQTDVNGVLAYKFDTGWDLALKAIMVFDNAQVAGDKLQQYRIIGNYKF